MTLAVHEPSRSFGASIVLVVCVVGAACLQAAAAAGAEIDFARRVAPLLAARCGSCHGPHEAESGYRIDLREKAFAGGDSAAAGIVAGKPDASELYVRITTSDKESRMPADGEPLTAQEQAILKEWIAAGAAWPDDLATLPESLLPKGEGRPAKGTGHWSFKPLERPDLPSMAGVPSTPGGQPANPIDAFIAATLSEKGLGFNPEADPRSLIRRVSFDLVGLPPSPEEIAAFEEACRRAGSTDGPYRELVNRLLASPHHGERWARHWLDVVRFAESNGYETNTARPNAWPYRDWVIAAFNDDMPFDLFAKAQIAGDAYGQDAATGFLVAGPKDEVKSPDIVLTSNQRADELHDIVGTTASAFLGLTVGCARCHDHKFDPVPQTDYYRIKAVFEGVQHGERPISSQKHGAERQRAIASLEREITSATGRLAELRAQAGSPALRPQVSPQENVDPFPAVKAKFLRFTVLATVGNQQPCLDELEVFATDGTNVARTATPTASSTLPGHEIHKLEHVNDGQYGNPRSWISNENGTGWVQLAFKEPAEIHRIAWSRDRSPTPQFSDRVATRYEVAVSNDGMAWQTVASDKGRIPHGGNAPAPTEPASLSPNERAEATSLTAQIAAAENEIKKLKESPPAYIGRFVQPGPTHRFFRGDPMAPRERIAPGTLTNFGGSMVLDETSPEHERRKRLAEWITSKDNPLTARVIANRLWHYHFGTGIVDTPSDLGVNGGNPSHRELLDWLASEIISAHWRLKHLHRLIVTSRTYRQSTAARPDGIAADSGSRLLWRYPPRRLEAEPLRDAILAVSGGLDKTMGGPGFDLFEPNTNYVKVYVTKEKFSGAEFRRMVYQSKPRAELDTFFGAFDCPDAGQVQPKRTVSTTPLQALNMLNGGFLLDQAARFANRVEQEAGPTPEDRVRRAVLLAFGRDPTPAEMSAAVVLVREHGLPMLCRSLYNASEFITVY